MKEIILIIVVMVIILVAVFFLGWHVHKYFNEPEVVTETVIETVTETVADQTVVRDRNRYAEYYHECDLMTQSYWTEIEELNIKVQEFMEAGRICEEESIRLKKTITNWRNLHYQCNEQLIICQSY